MSNSDVPLQLTGMEQRNIDLALALGNPATIIADAGHAAGVRMRDYGRFGQAGDNGTRSLLIECGFHGAPEAHGVALDQLARFLLAADTVDRADLPAAWFAPDAARSARCASRMPWPPRAPTSASPSPEGAGDAAARRRPDRLVRGRAGGRALR